MSKLLSITIAVGLSFLMFLGMTLMIEPDLIQVEPEPNPTVTIDYKEIDDKPLTIVRYKPKLELVNPPEVLTTVVDAPKPNNNKPRFTRVAFNNDRFTAGNKLATLWGGNDDKSAVPKVRINPRYPRIAATKGIEGFVTLTFDINAIGATENIQVVDSNPKGIFNKAARRALSKWKYEPKLRNTKAVPQPGQKVTLQFNLEKEFM